MTWRGSTDAKDRFFAALVYLMPLYDAVFSFGSYVLDQLPALRIILIPLTPVAYIYGSIPFAGLIIFFVLFLAVVRNPKISYFIRFNTLQAILLSIGVFLLSLARMILQIPFLWQTFSSVVFLAALGACLYSMIQSILGRYAEIPTISDAAYSQLR
ncbi:MAG: Tic20 family protein [Pleurocapsa sp.]